MAGIYLVIPLGLVCVVVGLILWASSRREMRLEHGRSLASQPSRTRPWLALGLILANLPAAWLFARAGLAIFRRVSITVVNESGRELRTVFVEGAGVRREMGPLAPGRSRNVWVFPERDGQLDLRVSDGTREKVATVVGYVCVDCGGGCRVEIRESLLINVQVTDRN